MHDMHEDMRYGTCHVDSRMCVAGPTLSAAGIELYIAAVCRLLPLVIGTGCYSIESMLVIRSRQ